ncbi:MAG TPA: hypothetical protein VFC18_20370 [Burkholderiales bacterium]|nr:hypothetical protein [Burkholderiales bacterium]
MSATPATLLERFGGALRALLGRRRRVEPIRDGDALRRFLQTRASYVAQMTLYGYLRTRAGVRFPELFDDDTFVASVNIAKWHVWLACLADLAAYAGGMLRRQGGAPDAEVGDVICRLVDEILLETGTPHDAGPEFGEHTGRVRARLRLCDWSAQTDDAGPFIESPAALVYWAPVVEELKALDEEIVRNSVRFRWQEVRQQLRLVLDARSVLAPQQDQLSPPGGA